jgi:hypothetical protein
VAGTGLLVMAVVSGVSQFGVIAPLTADGGTEAMVARLVDSAAVVRLAAGGLVVAAILDVVVAWGLHIVLRPVNPDLSLLGAWFRVAYAAVFVVAISNVFGAVQLASVDAVRAEARMAAFEMTWQMSLTLLGVHLGIIGLVVRRAWYITWIFGALLIVSGMGYLVDGFAAMVGPGSQTSLASYTFLGEVAFIGWLLIRGARLPDAAERPPSR